MPAKKTAPTKGTKPVPAKKAAPAKKAVAPVAKKVAPAPKKTAPVATKVAPKKVAAPVPAKAAPIVKKAAAPVKAAPAAKKVAEPAKAVAPVAAKAGKKVSVLFEKFSPESHSVEIVGSFNNWTLGRNILKRDANGVWSGKISLDPGSYEYKFVFDGLSYEADPGKEQVWGPFGANNILVVI